MDARQLEYFLAVVDNGSFNRAAAALHLAQPSLSQAIRTLERDLGSLLFHRIGRRVVLTEAGTALIEPARQVLHGLELARASVACVEGVHTGSVGITAMPSPAVEPLTSMIQRFRQRYPGVEVTIRAAATAHAVLLKVRTGETELGLLSARDWPAISDVALHSVEKQKFVLVTAPDGPFEPGRPVPRERLAGQRLIVGERGTGIRELVEDVRASGVDVTIAVESEHREPILPLVLKGVGIAILAESWTRLARRAGATVLDLDPPARLHVALVTRKKGLTPAARAFLAEAIPPIDRSPL
jgi:DNA-binding transcriptional LysR family regulator